VITIKTVLFIHRSCI